MTDKLVEWIGKLLTLIKLPKKYIWIAFLFTSLLLFLKDEYLMFFSLYGFVNTYKEIISIAFLLLLIFIIIDVLRYLIVFYYYFNNKRKII
jgi:hypothetical protein